jgi:hypothetical protein
MTDTLEPYMDRLLVLPWHHACYVKNKRACHTTDSMAVEQL